MWQILQTMTVRTFLLCLTCIISLIIMCIIYLPGTSGYYQAIEVERIKSLKSRSPNDSLQVGQGRVFQREMPGLKHMSKRSSSNKQIQTVTFNLTGKANLKNVVNSTNLSNATNVKSPGKAPEKRLSAGEIVGIVVGVVVFCIAAIAACCLGLACYIRNRYKLHFDLELPPEKQEQNIEKRNSEESSFIPIYKRINITSVNELIAKNEMLNPKPPNPEHAAFMQQYWIGPRERNSVPTVTEGVSTRDGNFMEMDFRRGSSVRSSSGHSSSRC